MYPWDGFALRGHISGEIKCDSTVSGSGFEKYISDIRNADPKKLNNHSLLSIRSRGWVLVSSWGNVRSGWPEKWPPKLLRRVPPVRSRLLEKKPCLWKVLELLSIVWEPSSGKSVHCMNWYSMQGSWWQEMSKKLWSDVTHLKYLKNGSYLDGTSGTYSCTLDTQAM